MTSARLAINGPRAEIEVPLTSIGSPSNFDFDVEGDNSAFGSSVGMDYVYGRFLSKP